MPTMKAWQASAYGAGGNPADTIAALKLNDVEIPVAGAGQVQIKIERAAVNPIDWKLFSGGLHGIVPCTFPYVPGFDLTGTVSAIGEGVTDFTVGEAVCVDTGLVETCTDPAPAAGNCGAFAEYAVAPVGLVAKTQGIDASSAAGLPLAGLTAYQALFTKAGRTFTGDNLGDLKQGHKVLVIGGATLVGSYAIQLAKNVGAYVACTSSAKPNPAGVPKVEACKALGADEVIDYTTAEWSDVLAGQDYDMIFDTVGSQDDWKNAAKVLKKGCDFISVANFGPDTTANETNVFKNFLLKSNTADLNDLVGMVSDGKLKVPIDSVVPMSDVPAALTKSLSSANAGKIIIDVTA